MSFIKTYVYIQGIIIVNLFVEDVLSLIQVEMFLVKLIQRCEKPEKPGIKTSNESHL